MDCTLPKTVVPLPRTAKLLRLRDMLDDMVTEQLRDATTNEGIEAPLAVLNGFDSLLGLCFGHETVLGGTPNSLETCFGVVRPGTQPKHCFGEESFLRRAVRLWEESQRAPKAPPAEEKNPA